MTTGLNAVITLLIIGRILYYARIARAPDGSGIHPQTGIVPICVESALPFTVLGILYAIYFGKQQEPGLAFGIVWCGFLVGSSLNEKVKIQLD